MKLSYHEAVIRIGGLAPPADLLFQWIRTRLDFYGENLLLSKAGMDFHRFAVCGAVNSSSSRATNSLAVS